MKSVNEQTNVRDREQTNQTREVKSSDCGELRAAHNYLHTDKQYFGSSTWTATWLSLSMVTSQDSRLIEIHTNTDKSPSWVYLLTVISFPAAKLSEQICLIVCYILSERKSESELAGQSLLFLPDVDVSQLIVPVDKHKLWPVELAKRKIHWLLNSKGRQVIFTSCCQTVTH